MYRCGVGLGPLKAVQVRESTSLCHGQIRTGLTQNPSLPTVSVSTVTHDV